MFDHFHAFWPTISASSPIGFDDPLLMRWHMIMRYSPQQPSHKKKGVMHLDFISLRDDTKIINLYQVVHWDSNADEAI